MEPFFNDYKVNIVEVARLTQDEISRFKSDFRILAEFVSRKRNDPDYGLNDTTRIIHVDEMMKLIAAITGDKRYTYINNTKYDDQYGGKIKTMCEIADRLEKRGIEKGINKGDELRLIRQIIYNKSKGKNALEMTEYLDESYDKIEKIYNIISEDAGYSDAETIYERLHQDQR